MHAQGLRPRGVRTAARASAAGDVAFRLMGRRRHPETVISRLNGWPARTPVNASLRPHGSPTHDSGPPWVATPSMSGVLIPFLMPVYPGAFPTFTTIRSMSEPPSSTPAASSRLRRRLSAWPPRQHRKIGFGVATRRWRALHPAHILQIGAGGTVTGRQALVPLVRRLISLNGPAPSGSTSASRRCQGCSHPRAHLGAQAALSFTSLLRQASLISARWASIQSSRYVPLSLTMLIHQTALPIAAKARGRSDAGTMLTRSVASRMARIDQSSVRVGRPWAQIWAHSRPSELVHRRPTAAFRAAHGRWRPLGNAGQHCWKACWGQPLASSNLASSAALNCKDTRGWASLNGLIVCQWAHSLAQFRFRFRTSKRCPVGFVIPVCPSHRHLRTARNREAHAAEAC